ncbi:MAG: hypothetical protein AAF657_29040 [Acidobacteriota bacterium]
MHRFDKRPALVACLAIFLATAATAQFEFEPALPEKAGRTVLFTTRYLDVLELQSILSLVDAEIVAKPSLNIIAARSEDDSVLDTIEKIIETLDVPPEPEPNIELSAYIFAGTGGSGQALPGFAGVESRLEALFGHRSFSLLDTIFLQIGDRSSGRVEGSFRFGNTAVPTGYQFHFDNIRIVPSEEGNRVRLDALTFDVTGENSAGVRRAMLRTDVEVADGHKAVVGKATPRGIHETLVVVVQAEVQKEE